MIKQEQVLHALNSVKDPELNRSLVELEMVRNIEISTENDIRLEVVLTISGCPLKITIKEDVEKALKNLGATTVDVHFGTMTDEERAKLAKYMQETRKNNVTLPVEKSSVKKTQKPITSDSPLLAKDCKTEFLLIASGKGGVGKSTCTVNLAVSLAKQGKKVGIIDADIYGFSIPSLMGIEQRPTVIDSIMLPVEKFGVKVASMGFFVKENDPVIWRGPMLSKMLLNFFDMIFWEELDYMVIDLPPGTGDVALDLHRILPSCKEIIITTPHETASLVAERAGTMARRTEHEIVGVIENMSYFEGVDGKKEYIFGQGGGEAVAKSLETRLLTQVAIATSGSTHVNGQGVYRDSTVQVKQFEYVAQFVIDRSKQLAAMAQ
ncbi:Mrp/NBP35 family ATP-binding protein [Halalkalibacter lacteus]|uniref:Mrp/NBP35 family ATP-binding protein n=1 Tax=Halalkalibacter lacteus TaxID=3090663 RepID=UPI002FC640BE